MAHVAQDFDALAALPRAEPPPPRPPPRVVAPEFDGWIPVADRLPPKADPPARFSVRVLVRVDAPGSGPTVAIDVYCDRRWGWSVHGRRVSHWRSLPSADVYAG